MKIHFIGIGGIGISGLAKFMLAQGHEVSGSDISETAITKELEKLGMDLTIPHNTSAIKEQALVIHSAIIRPDNVEVIAANKKNIKVLARREALPFILEGKQVYAVCGAHGKSTTTAILSSVLEGSAVIGAESKQFGNNVRHHEGNRLLFEADESDGSFLNSNPYCAIVPNAEPEHMEYYDYNFDRFYEAYRTFIASASLRIINAEDPFLSTIEGEAIRLYPSKDIQNLEFVLINDEPHTRFELLDMGMFEVWGFGEHIAIDAALAILAAVHTEDIEEVRKNLLGFKGIKKRFDIINKNDSILIDDYGHHPTEIKATLESVKAYADLMGIDKITAIWQPHKYSRTIDNLDAFIKCFEGASELIILPVWAAGEAKRKIDFEGDFKAYPPLMADSVKRSNNDLDIIKDNKVLKSLDKGLIVGFGAGDITYQLRGIA